MAAAAYDRTGPRLDSLSVPATGVAGSSVRFGVVPLDTWGAAASPHWDFGDGTSDSGSEPSHTYAGAGRYTVRVTSSDTLGNQSTAESVIDVANATPPTATTGSAVAVHRTSATITGIVDTVGQPTSYHFEWGPDYDTRTAPPKSVSAPVPPASPWRSHLLV